MKPSSLLLTFALALLTLFTSCGQKELSATDLKQEMGSGVVLVYNEYYYKLTDGDGSVHYFTGIVDDTLAHYTNDVDDIRPFINRATGTAFFINDRGMLLTNRHVAAPELDLEDVKKVYRQSMTNYSEALTQLMDYCSATYDELEQEIPVWTTDTYGAYTIDNTATEEKQEQQNKLRTLYNEAKDLKAAINYDTSGLKLEVVCHIGVAYDGTYPETFDDLKSCVRSRESRVPDIDLALIQLKDGQTPQEAHIFQIAGMDPTNTARLDEPVELTIGTPLFLMGFNQGFALGKTQNGLQLQVTGGQITQLPDNEKILYDMPSLPGSSGSPIVLATGEVVAVNFAKVSGSEGFNFGIPFQQVQNFLAD